MSDDGDPMRRLLADLARDRGARERPDVVYGTAGSRYELGPGAFAEIRPAPAPRRMAFVDGGNGILDSAPNRLISLNRVYYAIFRGERKIRARNPKRQKTTFLSCVVPRIEPRAGGGSGRRDAGALRWDTRVYAYGGDGPDRDADVAVGGGGGHASGCLPRRDDLLSIRDGRARVLQNSSPLASLARRLAELRLARTVVSDELDGGDVLVMDGSLETAFDVERRYADDLCDTAIRKGVIVCGLAKTTRLITEYGYPLMARISEISRDVPHGRWYVPVAERLFERSRSSVIAVKLHPNSRFTFRLDMLNEQLRGMADGEKDAVLGSLACNSNDVTSLGYPYGAIEADKHAQVRTDELAMCRRAMYSRRLGDAAWRPQSGHSDSVIFHDLLNRVTG